MNFGVVSPSASVCWVVAEAEVTHTGISSPLPLPPCGADMGRLKNRGRLKNWTFGLLLFFLLGWLTAIDEPREKLARGRGAEAGARFVDKVLWNVMSLLNVWSLFVSS